MDIALFANQRQTIIKILLLYLGSCAIFLCVGFYYLNEKMTQNILFSQMSSLRDISMDMLEIIRKNHQNVAKSLDEIKSIAPLPFAIYDRNDEMLFSNLSKNPSPEELKDGFYKFENNIVVNPMMIPHRAKYYEHKRKNLYKIFLQDESVEKSIFVMRLKLASVFLLIFVLMGIVASILVKLFLKPLNEYINALDIFIKDSTHEINTPLSVILMSVETLDGKQMPPQEQKKLQRIRLASLQLNSIYNALVAYNFPQYNKKQHLSLDSILKERLEFFTPFFIQKKIELKLDINESQIYAQKGQFITIFDNLLSNAIKYNLKNGYIQIVLKQNYFSIKNSGKGIESKNINKIFDRYARFSKDTGGFGIGLSLVKRICDEYKINISINNLENESEFILRW